MCLEMVCPFTIAMVMVSGNVPSHSLPKFPEHYLYKVGLLACVIVSLKCVLNAVDSFNLRIGLSNFRDELPLLLFQFAAIMVDLLHLPALHRLIQMANAFQPGSCLDGARSPTHVLHLLLLAHQLDDVRWSIAAAGRAPLGEFFLRFVAALTGRIVHVSPALARHAARVGLQ